jgi:hypothetical protein
MRNVSDKVVEKIKTTQFVLSNFIETLTDYDTMRKNIVERDRPQMTIWRRRIACSKTKATNTLSLCNDYCFSIAKNRFQESASYIACFLFIVCFVSFCVLFVCKRVLYYCHWVAIQLQLTNISYHIIYYVIRTLPALSLHTASFESILSVIMKN